MPTLYQGYVFMAMLYYGMIYGLINQIKVILNVLLRSKFVNHILDFIFAVIGGSIFWLGIFKSNLGIFRIFLLISYIFGYIIINFSISKYIEFLSKKMYNILRRKFNGK